MLFVERLTGFMFSSFWHFVASCLLLLVIEAGISSAIKAVLDGFASIISSIKGDRNNFFISERNVSKKFIEELARNRRVIDGCGLEKEKKDDI